MSYKHILRKGGYKRQIFVFINGSVLVVSLYSLVEAICFSHILLLFPTFSCHSKTFPEYQLLLTEIPTHFELNSFQFQPSPLPFFSLSPLIHIQFQWRSCFDSLNSSLLSYFSSGSLLVSLSPSKSPVITSVNSPALSVNISSFSSSATSSSSVLWPILADSPSKTRAVTTPSPNSTRKW